MRAVFGWTSLHVCCKPHACLPTQLTCIAVTQSKIKSLLHVAAFYIPSHACRIQGSTEEATSILIKQWVTDQVNISDLFITVKPSQSTDGISLTDDGGWDYNTPPGVAVGNATAFCAVSKAYTWQQVLRASSGLNQNSDDLHVFLVRNITLPPARHTTVNVTTRLRIAAMPGHPYPSYLSLGFFSEVGEHSKPTSKHLLSMHLASGTMFYCMYTQLPQSVIDQGSAGASQLSCMQAAARPVAACMVWIMCNLHDVCLCRLLHCVTAVACAQSSQGKWKLIRSESRILFESLWFPTLSLGPFEDMPMSTLPWGIWAVETNRYGFLDDPQLVAGHAVSRCAWVADLNA